MNQNKAGAVLFSMLFIASAAFAANPASDNASDPVYAKPFPQWVDGDNGGTGFSPWTLSPNPNSFNAGFFTATATQNGSFPSGGGIDTTSVANPSSNSWGLYADTNVFFNTAIAYRSFTGGSLGVGQTFTIGMDNGFVDADGGTVGFVLRAGNNVTNKNDGQRFEFLFSGGDCCYQVSTNFLSPVLATGMGYTDGGLLISFTLTGADTFSCTITSLVGGTSTNITGTLGGPPGAGIDSVALYNQWAGNGQNFDLFFNSMSVTGVVSSPFTITSIKLLGGTNAVVSFDTSSGTVYSVEANTNLLSGAWSAVASNINGTGGSVQITNPVPAGTPKEFYRARHP
jgi:hypothetical protein